MSFLNLFALLCERCISKEKQYNKKAVLFYFHITILD